MANKNKYGYEYIWATPLNTRFGLETSVSAYTEINSVFLNGNFITGKTVKVNPYIRFNKIFTSFLNYYDNFFEIEKKIEKNLKIKNLTKENLQEKKSEISNFRQKIKENNEKIEVNAVLKNFKKNVENNAINYLKELDFISGTTVIDVICEKISEDIKSEVLGTNLKKYFLSLNKKEQQYISLLIYNCKVNNVNCIKNFKLGIKYFFSDSVIYREKEQKNKIIIYINKHKTKKNIVKIKILELLFLRLGLKLKVFWKNHFGVVSVDETVKINEVAAF